MPNQPTFIYTVVPGDIVPSLAAAFGTTPAALRDLNRLAPDAPPRPGQRLRIPRPSRGYGLDGSFPAGTRQLIEAAAHRFHVDVALALAIAWQESRARQSAVSDRHAIGIMQMEPDTAEQVAVQIGSPIDLENAYDNVTAGVYWLGYLLQSYSGDVQKAVAAYYEGQTNLSRYGYLPDARRYMQSVLRFRIALAST
jgi:soluble lytic murein transglycosylase-like protein